MKILENVEIDGVVFPLLFSFGAAKRIAARLGSLDNLTNLLQNGVTADSLEDFVFILREMIYSGISYQRSFCKDVVDELSIPSVPSLEDLEERLDFHSLENVNKAIVASFSAGLERKVEVKPGKNVDAPPVST